jgi:hypothetical protein
MTKEVFEYRTFTRLKQLGYLIRTKQIDPQFFWTSDVGVTRNSTKAFWLANCRTRIVNRVVCE